MSEPLLRSEWRLAAVVRLVGALALISVCGCERSPLEPTLESTLEASLEAPLEPTLDGATSLSAWRSLPVSVLNALNTAPRADPLKALAPLAPPLSDLSRLSPLPRTQHLCVGLEGGAPTIAWRDHESPALRWTQPPPEAQELLLLMIDWDAPQHAHWAHLNSAHLDPLSPQALSALQRAPFVLWASVGLRLRSPHAPLSALKGLPRGFGGRGWALKGREAGYFAQGGEAYPSLSPGYSALNDYSGWFKGSDLSGSYGGYGGPCVPLGDPRPHRVSALLFALTRPTALPSHGAPSLTARALLKRAFTPPLTAELMVSQVDWRAALPHDQPSSPH